VRDRLFREDLYYRLNVVTLHLPPLRARREDIPALVEHLLERINRNLGKSVASVSAAAMQALRDHTWPGNVRELENVLTRAALLAHGSILTPDLLDLPAPEPLPTPDRPEGGPPGPLLSLAAMEAWQVRAVLEHTTWHRGRACAILGISRPALERKIRKYRLV
jgi:DNA-binding NtrC family response regulator